MQLVHLVDLLVLQDLKVQLVHLADLLVPLVLKV